MSHPATDATLPSLLDAVRQIEPVIRAYAADAERVCLPIMPSECTDDGGRRAMGLLRSHRLSAVVG